MTTIIDHLKKKGLKNAIFTIALTILVSFNSISQVISNPTVLNSMNLSNITPTSATLNWMFRSNEFDSDPSYILYSRTSSQTLYNSIAGVNVALFPYTQTPQSISLNVTGLQPATTYTWFLNVLDEARGMSEPLLMNNYNNGTFLGYSFLTTSVYQYITFTTPNTNGMGGTAGLLTTVSNSTIPSNQPPVANAGPDVVLPVGATSTTLNGLGSFDADGGIMSFNWAKIDGPAVYSLNTCCSPQVTVSNLTTGTYTFRLTIYDSRGAGSQDFVTLIINSGNRPPTVKAGADQTITLPTNSVILNGSATDIDGSITNYVWSVLSGPSIYGLASPITPTSAFSNLQQGTYTLQLKATDNSGSSGADTVLVIVKPAAAGACTNDNFESNNTSGTAAAISVGLTIQAKICPLTDVDFFKFNNRNNQKNIRVTLLNQPTNYVLELFAPNGNLVGTSNAANTQNKVIVFNTTVVGTYKIKISAGIGATANNSNYSLLAETSKNNFAQPAGFALRQTLDAEKNALLKDNEISFSAFNIYPNPSSTVVNIAVPQYEVYSNISVFNLSGQLVKTAAAKKNITSLNVVDLKQGIYLVKVITASGKVFSKKITVSR